MLVAALGGHGIVAAKAGGAGDGGGDAGGEGMGLDEIEEARDDDGGGGGGEIVGEVDEDEGGLAVVADEGAGAKREGQLNDKESRLIESWESDWSIVTRGKALAAPKRAKGPTPQHPPHRKPEP